jgi:SNF2 family DNA or RNA helicase
MKRGILADEQGMGKTVQALDAAKRIESSRRLIVCSRRKYSDWLEHIEKWDPGNSIEILSSEYKDRDRRLSTWSQRGGYLICNYKSVSMFTEELTQADNIILDEAHKIRNRKSQMAISLRKICEGDKSVFMLTASPTINGMEDLWILLNLCDPRRWSSFWSFVFRFLSVSNNGFGIKIGEVRPEEQDNLNRVIDRYVLQRPQELLKHQFKVRRHIIKHEMIGDQFRIYESMMSQGESEYKGQTVASAGAISQITRALQISLTPQLIFPSYNGPSKIDTLIRILKEKTAQTVVFTKYEKMADLTQDRLLKAGFSVLTYTGKLSGGAAEINLEAFNRGRTQILLLTHGTGGEGIELQVASRLIFLDLMWHPMGNKQAQDRVIRPGQAADEVEIIVIHTVDSIEDHVREIIKDKIPVTIKEILRRMKDERNNDQSISVDSNELPS